MTATLIIGSYSLLALTSLYLIVRNRSQYILYSVVLILMLGSIAGSIFRILHLPGADQLLLTGLAGTVTGAGLLIWRSFQNRQKQILFYKLMAGAIILLQVAIMFLLPAHHDKLGLLNYPVTAFCATILINAQHEHEGERNIVILFTLQGFLYILIDVLKLL